MGVEGLFASLLTVFQALAFVWIGLFVAVGALLVRAVVKSRDEEWIRSQDEVDRLERETGLKAEKRDEEAA